MHKDANERVIKLRDYLGLSRKDLSQKIGMSLANISRIEKGVIEPSDAFMNALYVHYSVNPEWIKTGEGDMMIAPEEYFANGIKLLGAQRFGEGLDKVLNDPKFAEVQAYLRAGELTQGSLGRELEAYLKYILETWHQGDERLRNWLMVQLGMAFRDVAERLEKDK